MPPTPHQLWTYLPETRTTLYAVAARSGDVVGADGDGHVWSLHGASGTIRWRGKVIAPTLAVAISSDGRHTYALGARGHFVIFDHAGTVVSQEVIPSEIIMMDLDPGGKSLLFSDGVAATWQRDLRTDRMQKRPLDLEAAALRFIPARDRLAVMLPSGTAALVSIDGGLPKRIRGDGRLLEMTVAAHGNVLAFAAGPVGLIITDGEGNETSRIMIDTDTSILHIDGDAAGSRFAVADHRGRAMLLDAAGRVFWDRPADAAGPVSGVRLSGNGKRLVVVSSEGAFHAYDVGGATSAMTSTGAVSATPSKERSGMHLESVAGGKASLWRIPAFAGIRANYLGTAAISAEAGLIGFLDRDRRLAWLLDMRGTPLASASLTGSDLTIGFVDAKRLIVTGAEGVLALTADVKRTTMERTRSSDFAGATISPGVPFALGWTSFGEVIAVEWDGTERWKASAGRTRITHGVLSRERLWIVNAEGAVAELDPDGKLRWKATPLTAPASAAVEWKGSLAVASGRKVLLLGPWGDLLRTLKTRGTVAALVACGEHLVVRDGEDRLTMYNSAGSEEATGGPWPGRWAVTESPELGGIVLLQAEVDMLTCHRPGVGVAWKVKTEDPIVEVKASVDGRFCVVLEGPRMSLWAIGTAALPEARASYLEL